MRNSGNPNGADVEFRRTRRWILILSALFFPVFFVGSGLNSLFHSEVSVTLCEALWFVLMIYLSVRSSSRITGAQGRIRFTGSKNRTRG